MTAAEAKTTTRPSKDDSNSVFFRVIISAMRKRADLVREQAAPLDYFDRVTILCAGAITLDCAGANWDALQLVVDASNLIPVVSIGKDDVDEVKVHQKYAINASAQSAVAIAFAHLANDVLMRQSLELAATAWKKVPSAWFDKEPDHSRFQAEIALHALCDEQVRREMVAEAEVTLREIPNGVNLLLLRSLIRHGGKDHALALLVNVDPQSRENGLFAIAEELASEGSLLEARNLVAPEIANGPPMSRCQYLRRGQAIN